MKLWVSSETQANVSDALRILRNEIAEAINEVITERDYDIGVNGWDVIIILQSGNDSLSERIKFHKAKRDMDFRLALDFDKFVTTGKTGRLQMIFSLLIRSLDVLKKVGGNVEEIDRLIADVKEVGRTHAWL